MPATITNLGQLNPAATTETDLYVNPALTTVTLSSIIICNQGVTDATFNIAVVAGGGAAAAKDFLFFEHPIPAKRTFIATIGDMLNAADVIRVEGSNANLSFKASGIVNT